ncbi:protein of unknown function [Streptococcus thermophilus]|nr:protein of unknown function [Streptococcus thermophilus]CAD0133139.1 protein of unknown function [Streptococcus thermophilus]CAD0168621.1 protein of unknown function [Streptococcus thermophilus]
MVSMTHYSPTIPFIQSIIKYCFTNNIPLFSTIYGILFQHFPTI